MLFNGNNILISFSCQQFQCENFEIIENDEIGSEKECVAEFHSTLSTDVVYCPYCGGKVSICGEETAYLKDMPIFVGVPQGCLVHYHRYRCKNCGKKSTENISLSYPGTRVTNRAARWVESLLKFGMTISAVSNITGIHWDTIRKIHKDSMELFLTERRNEQKRNGYKPKYLAVDEFAIHKGHTYATCVMDLVEGDVIWVGKGRSMEDFAAFFRETDMEYLSEVKAVAMDMNASYNNLVEANMPYAEIVYDRYHMQAQFGRDVLGSVRLEEARSHQARAKELDARIDETSDRSKKEELKAEAKEQRQLYSNLKKSRWTLLMNSANLSEGKLDGLNRILNDHANLAVCYAMKEEMCDLFELTDEIEARSRWSAWFEAAKNSNIPALVKFASQKERRLEGLIAHSRHPISTGKLEGLNNKIKVCKRIGYGYRDDDYFFTLIRFVSLPSVRLH